MKKILVCGSHFTVAQAVVEQLLRNSDLSVEYVGRRRTMEGDRSESVESKIVPSMGVKYHTLVAGRISRSFGIEAVKTFLKIPIGFVQAFGLIMKVTPDLVLSFGGYISVPVVIAAKLRGIPVLLHEQTLISGLSNRVCSLFADRVAVSYSDGNYDFDPKKMVVTGNPIREELLKNPVRVGKVNDFLVKANKDKQRVIYVTGGNQGAQVINNTVADGLEKLIAEAMVIWQTGDSKYGNFENASKVAAEKGVLEKVLIAKWFDAPDVGLIYRNVDLVICRGGINTLNELAHFGLKAIVVPYPFLYHDEQLVNARYFEKFGRVKVILQTELNSDKLIGLVKEQFANQTKNVKEQVSGDDSAGRVVAELLKLLKV